MLQDVGVVRLVEALRGGVLLRHVLQHLVEDVEARLGDVTHRVLERPDDRVEHQLELGGRDREERCTHTIIQVYFRQYTACFSQAHF